MINSNHSSLIFILILVFQNDFAVAHQGHHHGSAQENKKIEKKSQPQFVEINQGFVKSVKPIFEKKCMDCHGGNTNFPWYYKLPIAKQLIDSDIAESKKHLDFSKGFPFEGHGTPKEDLEAIREVTEKKTMPPFRYRFTHWDSALTEEERKIVYDWVEKSLKNLPADE